jgi:iron(III) transport system substrate-binding protein
VILGALVIAPAAPVAWAASASPRAGGSPAAARPETLEELAAYRGADRLQILEEGAQAEGQLTWVSELAGGVIDALDAAFEAKYPFITVDSSRADGVEFAPRMAEEAQAGRHTVDVFEMSSDTMLILDELDIRLPYWTPALETYPESSLVAAGDDLILSALDRWSFTGFGYNTTLLDPEAVPATYADLLDPALTGNLAFEGDGSTGAQVFVLMIATEGEDFPQQLAAQNYTIQQVSGRGLLDLIIAGEVVASPTIFRNHVLTSADEGAPVAWVPLEPVNTNAGGSAVHRNAPHPHAALLWTEFILGPEGQSVIADFHYGNPATPDEYDWEIVYPGAGLTAEEYDAQIREMDALMRQLAAPAQ